MQTENKQEVIIQRIDDVLNKLHNKDFTIHFFVVDSNNVPNGSMAYIYHLAKTLQNEGYKVKMLYQIENEATPEEIQQCEQEGNLIPEDRVFTGVTGWMGEEYTSLEHLNISQVEWSVNPADFLFIPEVFSSLMYQTMKYNLPCKRYVLMHNYDYVTEFIPFGVQWSNYGITDVLTTSEAQATAIKEVFPYVKPKVLPPAIDEAFRKPILAQKLIVNILTKRQEDVNRIIKPFYWKYPAYRFVSFRDLRNFPRAEYSELLKEGAIAVWVDPETPFGYAPLEAMRCNNIVIGQIPNNVPEWMGNDEHLHDNGLWVNNIREIPDALATIIGAWMKDNIPSAIYEEMDKTNTLYTTETWNRNVKDIFDNILNERIKEIEDVKIMANKK